MSGSPDSMHIWGNDHEVVCCEAATPNLAVTLIENTWGSADCPSVSGAWLFNLHTGWQVAQLCLSGHWAHRVGSTSYFSHWWQTPLTQGSWWMEKCLSYRTGHIRNLVIQPALLGYSGNLLRDICVLSHFRGCVLAYAYYFCLSFTALMTSF